MAQTYRDLIAWQKAVDLVELIYRMTRSFPKEELYGLVSQLRRAAVSVPSNIAEGQARYSNPDFQRFLRTAKGSLVEIETQLLISARLTFITKEQEKDVLGRTAELGRILNALITSIQKRTAVN